MVPGWKIGWDHAKLVSSLFQKLGTSSYIHTRLTSAFSPIKVNICSHWRLQWLAVGGWLPLAVGGGWLLAVGGWWRLAAGGFGGWRLVVPKGGP